MSPFDASLLPCKEFTVRSFDCDAHTHLRLSSLFEYLQETALHAAETQGIGYRALLKQGYALLISRVKARISQMPLWGETLTVSTWLKGYEPEKVAWQDYVVRDASGNAIVEATSSWLLIDLKTGKSVPHFDNPYRFTEYPGLHALPETIDLLEGQGMAEQVLAKHVRYSDLDLNKHVNNCRYADWILDTLSLEEIRARPIRSIQMNYLAQIPYDAKVALMRFPAHKHHITVFGINADNPAQVHFQARIGFEG
jgi:medium-chain acyl-[acyl-carrier-protein] hydrolase